MRWVSLILHSAKAQDPIFSTCFRTPPTEVDRSAAVSARTVAIELSPLITPPPPLLPLRRLTVFHAGSFWDNGPLDAARCDQPWDEKDAKAVEEEFSLEDLFGDDDSPVKQEL